MKTFVFHSYRHEPFQLAGKLLRGNSWLELSEAEANALTPEEREVIKVARARRELSVHQMSDGRPVEDRRELVVEPKAPVEPTEDPAGVDDVGSGAVN